ncbi:MAG: hypothetical protein IJT03_06910 [Clostridia bacterium]|nr:hypothetical protein [Clostridia bacterium]
MRYLKIITVLAALLTLASCAVEGGSSVSELLEAVNDEYGRAYSEDSFTLSRSTELVYSAVPEAGTMIRLYADTNYVVFRAVITTVKNLKYAETACAEFTSALTGEAYADSVKAVKTAEKDGSSPIGDRIIIFVDVAGSKTFIICGESDVINTSDKPTLKRFVDDEDVSRPTVGDGTASTADEPDR